MIKRRIVVQIVALALLALLAGMLYTGSAANAAGQISQNIWRDVAEASIAPSAPRQVIPTKYRTIAADLAALDALLASAPLENATATESLEVTLPLPLPDGTFGRFHIQEYAMMEPALAAQFPEIKTYLGQGVDDPTATVRLDRTPAGFHGMILSSGDTIYIDPYSPGDITHYISYFKGDFDPGVSPLASEMMEADPAAASRLPDLNAVTLSPSGSQLRLYRTAVAATGEYTQFHGGTVSAGLAAITTSVNRVTGIYERDVAVRLVLVANNNLIVYTNAASDPYTNNSGSTMLGQNQTNLDNVIGSANYDLGHVFSTGGGGVASLAVTCRAGLKARGVTGSPSPVGDPFDVDYVAHEMGHQFGANHTFNGTTSSCGGGNRNASTAYEPGSGSTIMAYAGICGAEDLQPNSDDEFHTISYDEILAYTTSGMGNSCPVINATGNSAPVVDAGANFTIPRQTPFTLTGSATDPNGDSLTYSWEQFDLGAAAPPNTDNGNRPIFRVFNPVSSPARTFPKLSDILNNTTTLGESLPTTTRVLTFRLMVRDNRVGGGGVDYDTVTLNVTSAAGPFSVTAPNTAVTWAAGSSQTVTWNVASTNLSPVSCPSVNLLLSTNGGNTFTTTLASGTPNDGTQTITVPSVNTTTARVKVACANNIFFDISNVNFTISGGGPTPTPTPPPTPTATPPSGGSDTIYVSSDSSGNAGGVAFADEDVLAYNTGAGTWSLYFDGSDVGLGSTDVSGFALLANGHILLSFQRNVNIAPLGDVDDSDIVEFTPTSTGSNTAGSFAWYFDGSDVGLTTSGEKIDAIDFAPNGRLVISTSGSVSVTGVSGQDEDLLAFTATTLGATTSGTWELYFDGSDVGLTDSSEDTSGVWIDAATNEIYLSVIGAFSVSGASGDAADIFICDPVSLGDTTSCTFSPYWDGSANGFAGEVIDGVTIVK